MDGLADFYRKLWAQGSAGVEVRLKVQRAAAAHDITIKSEDRYDWLRLRRTLLGLAHRPCLPHHFPRQ